MNAVAVNPRTVSWWSVARVLLAIVVAAVGLSAFPAMSGASLYEVRECSGTAGAGAAPDAVYYSNAPEYYPAWLDCPPGGGVYMYATSGGGPAGAYGSWRFSAPVGTVFKTVEFNYCNDSTRGYGVNVADWVVSGSTIVAGPWTSGCVGYGVASPAGGATALHADLACSGGPSWCDASTQTRAQLWNLRFDVLDSTPPELVGLGGSLMVAGARSGTQSLTIAASDVGGGVREAQVLVNGVEIAHPQSSCSITAQNIATALRPCPSANYAVSTNTQAVPWHDGANSLQVCVYDVSTAGPPLSSCTQRTVAIDNSCPDSQGTSQATAMVAGLENPNHDLRPSLVVRSSEGATIRGTLAGPSGAVGGANVCLFEQIDAPAEIRQLAQIAKTKSDGTFAIQIPPGPSRVFDLRYRFSGQVVEKKDLYLDSVVKPSLKIGPKGGVHNGQDARFLGDIPGPHPGDRAISLQARAGKKWRTFKTLTTNDNGEFRGRYRFTHTTGSARYSFRVAVKKQNGYPYSPGVSETRRLRVSG